MFGRRRRRDGYAHVTLDGDEPFWPDRWNHGSNVDVSGP
jgi:hypothetical protein